MAIYTTAILSCFFCLAAAYPGGAPDEACGNFRPQHLNGQTNLPIKAQNENDQFEDDDSDCPFEVSYSRKFTPGRPIKLNITTKDSNDYFRGYILAVVYEDANGATPQGVFGPGSKKICNGSAVTHSNGERRTFEEIQWTAPADSSKKNFFIWMTVVHSFSKYWLNCNPTVLSAIDAQDFDSSFMLPTEDLDHHHGKDNDSSIFSHDHSKQLDRDDSNSKDDISSSSLIESEEDPDSVGEDDSGDSDENSVDVSDNRSGSSLNSDEKEAKRQQYFAEGIENFDSDIKKFLVSVDKASLYEQFKNGEFKSGATAVSSYISVVVMAIAMLTLA